MNKRLLIDSLFATVFIFFLMWFVSIAFGWFKFLDPVGDALGDVDLTDLVFGQLREDPLPDTNIVMVNIGELGRAGIAEQINIISKYEPAVIGIDVLFEDERSPDFDFPLQAAIASAGNVVLVSRVSNGRKGKETFDTLFLSHPKFSEFALDNAFANLITGAQNQDQFKVCRTFAAKAPVDNMGVQIPFGVRLAMALDSAQGASFMQRDKEVEIINYSGNVLDQGSENIGKVFSSRFYALDWMDVLNENFVSSIIKDKIVILGYLGREFGDPSWDDKFYTPMNAEYAGRTNPDMFGAVIHANIASMVLNDSYVNGTSNFWGIVLGIIICFINVYFFSMIYVRLGRWYDGLTKLIQLAEAIVLMAIIVFVFDRFDYKIDLTLATISVLLAGDALEVYYGVVKNLFSARGRKELFKVAKAR